MDDVIAVRVQYSDRETRYFLTWGRIQDPVDPGPVEAVVRRYVESQSPATGDRTVKSVTVCDSLREAADSRYFYEGFLVFAMRGIATGEGYADWVERKRAIMDAGREIYDCGVSK